MHVFEVEFSNDTSIGAFTTEHVLAPDALTAGKVAMESIGAEYKKEKPYISLIKLVVTVTLEAVPKAIRKS